MTSIEFPKVLPSAASDSTSLRMWFLSQLAPDATGPEADARRAEVLLALDADRNAKARLRPEFGVLDGLVFIAMQRGLPVRADLVSALSRMLLTSFTTYGHARVAPFAAYLAEAARAGIVFTDEDKAAFAELRARCAKAPNQRGNRRAGGKSPSGAIAPLRRNRDRPAGPAEKARERAALALSLPAAAA